MTSHRRHSSGTATSLLHAANLIRVNITVQSQQTQRLFCISQSLRNLNMIFSAGCEYPDWSSSGRQLTFCQRPSQR